MEGGLRNNHHAKSCRSLLFGKALLHYNVLVAVKIDSRYKLLGGVELGNLISTADGLAVDENVGHGFPVGHVTQHLLDLWAEGVLVQFDDVRGWLYAVLFQQYALGSLGVRTV